MYGVIANSLYDPRNDPALRAGSEKPCSSCKHAKLRIVKNKGKTKEEETWIYRCTFYEYEVEPASKERLEGECGWEGIHFELPVRSKPPIKKKQFDKLFFYDRN